MLGKLRAHLTYANVVSSLCLFLLLGGVAWAASLPGNSVGPSQIRKDAVGTSEIKKNGVSKSEIKDGGVGAPEVKNGSLTVSEFAPGVQFQGQQGAQGAIGPRGPSNAHTTTGTDQTVPNTETTVATLNLPAGSYVLLATAALFNASAVDEAASCNIYNQGAEVAAGVVSVTKTGAYNDTVALTTAATNSGGAATFTCSSRQGTNIQVSHIKFQAIQVETLTTQP